MPTGDKHDLIRRYVEEAWNQGDLTVIDAMFAPDCQSHALWDAPVHYHEPADPTHQQIKDSITAWRREMPDLRLTLDDVIEGADKAVLRATLQATYKGYNVRAAWLEIYRFADGRVVEEWYLWDRLSYWQQLGRVPPTRALLGPDRV